jgi:hypothetical protein
MAMLEKMPGEHRVAAGADKGVRRRGIEKSRLDITFAAAAYNLARMKNLLASPVGAL